MLGAALCFALMAICAKSVEKTLPVGEVVFARNVVLAAALLAWARMSGARDVGGKDRRLLFVRGLVGIASIFAYFWAIHRMKTGDAVLLQNTSPIFVALLAPFALGERPRRVVWIALVLGFAGVAVVQRGDAMSGAAAVPLDGLAAGLASPLLAAAAYVSVRKLSRTDRPMTIVLWFAAIGTLVSAATLPFAFRVPSLEVAPALAGVAVFGGLAQLFMTSAYAVGDAAEVSVFAYAQPVFAYALGQALLGESVGWQGVAGAALLIVAGVAVSAARS